MNEIPNSPQNEENPEENPEESKGSENESPQGNEGEVNPSGEKKPEDSDNSNPSELPEEDPSSEPSEKSPESDIPITPETPEIPKDDGEVEPTEGKDSVPEINQPGEFGDMFGGEKASAGDEGLFPKVPSKETASEESPIDSSPQATATLEKVTDKPKSEMGPRIMKLFKLSVILVVLVLIGSWVSKNVTFVGWLPVLKKDQPEALTPVSEIPVPVKGYRVARIDFTDTLPALGTAKGYLEVEMKFAGNGYIEYINFRDGEKAIEGDIIASLDQREALLKLEYAKNEMDNNQRLLDLGAIIEAKFLQSKLEYQSARLEYEKTNLIAPYDGYVGAIQKQKGDYVTPNDIFGTFVNLTDAYMEFGIIEKDVNKVRIGQAVTVTVDSYPRDSFSGEIESISPIVEGRTRTFKVRARVVNEDEKLKAGMFGRIAILIYEKDNTLVIPSSAFRKKEQEYFVYVVHQDMSSSEAGEDEFSEDVVFGSIEVRPIQIAYATPDAVEIKAGLDDGELIVADIQQELEEKAKVEVTEIQDYIF